MGHHCCPVDHPGQGEALRDRDDLYVRIEAEFREMPGLALTLPQAARLFSIEPAQCERVFDALVHDGRLATNGRMFALARPRTNRRWD
jgi:hypothetical protein